MNLRRSRNYEIIDFRNHLAANLFVAELEKSTITNAFLVAFKDKTLWSLQLKKYIPKIIFCAIQLYLASLVISFIFTFYAYELPVNLHSLLLTFESYSFYILTNFFFIVAIQLKLLIFIITSRYSFLRPFDHAIKKHILVTLSIDHNKYDLDYLYITKKNKFSN